jgi:hypothetical protein
VADLMVSLYLVSRSLEVIFKVILMFVKSFLKKA